MSLAWLFPGGLVALAALLLPVLLHLARRDERQLLDFAALRWLSAKPQPRRRLRFDEWPLLLVRLLLLASLALLLARPALIGVEDSTPRVALVPGVDVGAARTAIASGAAQWLWLSPGFPALDAQPAASSAQPVASLLRELDAALPAGAPLTVVVPAVLDGLDAQRPRLSREVRWQVIESTPMPADTSPRAPLRLHVRHDAAGAAAVPWLRALGQAWNPGTPADITDDTRPFDDDGGILAWLSAKPLPATTLAWARNGGHLLVDARTPEPEDAQHLPLWRDDAGNLVIEQVTAGNGQWLRWAMPVQPATMPVLLDAGFPPRLRNLLQPAPAPTRAPATTLQAETGAETAPPPARELAAWLVVASALLFLLERWLASAPRRRRQA